MSYPDIVILTGAGISAESGIKTFRDSDGLWENHRIEDVASPEGFQRDPDLVYRFYNARRQQLLSDQVVPNPAHFALAQLSKEYKGRVTIITQNIDDLHERAGSKDVFHMHGELLKARCNLCGDVFETKANFDSATACVACDASGGLRPHIVWFGEVPFYMDEISAAMDTCAIFAAIGTSGLVYPAAGFVEFARTVGAKTVELNLAESAASFQFHETRRGTAGETVPLWVTKILNG